jgi:PAS domain S-box-containing protein
VLDRLPPDELPESESKSSDLRGENERLRAEVDKLKKINQVLMRRVELGWGNHSDAYQSFENAALLSDKVRERTLKLNQTMGKLEAANLELTRAQRESAQARQRLVDSVESIFDAFALFDHKDQIVLANSRFYEIWAHTDLRIEMGKTCLAELVEYSLENRIFDFEFNHPSVIKIAANRFGNSIYRLYDKRWVQTSERSTADGGLVLTFTDITVLKNSETRQRELALEEQARILEATVNNMSQGVALIDASCRLLAWNTRFLEISGLPIDKVHSRADFNQLIASCELYVGSEQFPPKPKGARNWSIQEHEKILSDGSVVLIRRHLVPGGGFVNTYTDITERSQQQAALRESERRIRLITDAVPALISYIDKDLLYRFANQQFETWFDTSRENIVGRPMLDVLGEQAFAKHRTHVQQALRGETVEFEIEEHTSDDTQRIIQKTYVPHYDHQNTVIGFFSLEQDVTRERRTKQALKDAYDTLEDRVNERTRQISEINEKLRDEIRERRQIEKSLLQAKREAEEANLSKIKFLAATSHDLLQPLNAACLFASSLQERELPPDTHHLVKSLSYSLNNIESLISALVDISKLDAGVVEPEPGVFNVDDLLGNLANEFRQQCEGCKIEFHYIKSRVSILSDSQLLARILRNFLTNAFRYTQQGRVVLGARRRHNGLEVQVLDTGAGINEQDLEMIFREFHRGQSHVSREDRGLGLGLAIVDKISRILEHPIRVSSRVGVGSCFSVLIPYAPQPPHKDSESLLHESNNELIGANQRVMVIDNDDSICEGMRILLEGWGCVVDTLQTNPQIESLIEQGFEVEPDLIIADYHLDDGVTGLDVVRRINAQRERPVPVLLITANYTTELRQQARELGYHLLNKPIKPVKLKLAMNHLMQGGLAG